MSSKLIILLLQLVICVYSQLRIPLEYGSDTPSTTHPTENISRLFSGVHRTDEHFNQAYSILIYVGSQKTKMKLMLDSTTIRTWVPGYQCVSCNFTYERFYQTESETFTNLTTRSHWQNDFHDIGGSNLGVTHSRYAEGYSSRDIFVPPNLAGTKIQNEFILVDMTENLGDFKSDGVLGLSNTYVLDNTTSFIGQLYNSSVIKRMAFNIYFGRQGGRDSELSFGDYSHLPLENATFLNVLENIDKKWAVPITDFCYGKNACLNRTVAAFYHTGYPTVGLPVNLYDDFITMLEPDRVKHKASGTPFLYMNCTSREEFEEFSYTVANKTIRISKFELMIRIDQRCIVYIYPIEGSFVILGIPAMRGVPMIFDIDKSQVGFLPQTTYEFETDTSYSLKWVIVGVVIAVIIIFLIVVWCCQRNIRHRKQRNHLNYLLNEMDSRH